MAENLFPEYDDVDLVGGSKQLAALQKELTKIANDLRNGYTIDKSGLRHDLVQFSPEYNALLDSRANISARIPALRAVLVGKAQAWKPLSGPETSGLKAERKIVEGLLKSPAAGVTADVRVGVGVAPVKPVVASGGLRGGSVDRLAPVVPATAGAIAGTGTGTGVVSPTGTTASVVAPKGGKGKGKGNGAAAVADTSWEPLFKSQYPQYAWMFTDEMKAKYPDVFQLFKEASADPEFDKNLFARRFDGSSWYTELKASSKSRELISSIGSFTWGSGNLAKFLTTAEQYSWTGEALKQNAYQELFRKGGDGKYANDLAVKEVQASTPYLKLKKIGTQFLAPMDDARVIESLTGGISSDDVLRLARERAKAMYPHLAESINAGLTLEDLAYDYKQMAARTLELTPEQVDMSNAKFNVALKSGEGGKERMMSTGEWQQTLRTDPQYKFFETRQANRDATDIALSIARAFGRVG